MIRRTRKPVVDWFRILADLRREGYTHVHVAKALDVSRSCVRNWSYGQTPIYDSGRALILLWRRVCYRKKAEKGQQKSVQTRNGSDRDPSEQLAPKVVSDSAMALP